jgi:hypothetical protein
MGLGSVDGVYLETTEAENRHDGDSKIRADLKYI